MSCQDVTLQKRVCTLDYDIPVYQTFHETWHQNIIPTLLTSNQCMDIIKSQLAATQFMNSSLSPWTNNITLLESSVSPSLKLALHWMLVLLYSTDMSLKRSIPSPVGLLKSVTTLVRLRSSSCVSFMNHSTFVTVSDGDAQLNIGSPPGIKTLPLEELSVTRK